MNKNSLKLHALTPHKLKKQVRTKRVCSHPNPLFEKWLKEWKVEAENRGSKMKYNYQKAIKSLQKFPLPLHSGKDCLVLSSFGQKICSLIDKKLEEYIEENGPINWEDHIKVNDLRKPSKPKRIRKKLNNSPISKNLSSKSSSSSSSAQAGKMYIPSFRSGGYALLLTLYRKSKDKNFKGFLKKSELIDAAQDLCDASLTIPPEGSHYTAWSSMSNLIKRNYVERNGNPSRYSLTTEGEIVASTMEVSNIIPTPPSSVSSSVKERISRIVESSSSERLIKSTSCLHDISDSNDDDECDNHNNDQNDISIIDDNDCDDYDNDHNISIMNENDCVYHNNDDDAISIIDGIDHNNDDNDISIINDNDHNNDNIFNHNTDDEDEISIIDDLSTDKESSSKSGRITEKTSDSSASSCTSGSIGLSFTYVTTDERVTSLKKEAFVMMDEDRESLLFLIRAKLIDLLSSDLDYQMEDTREAPPGYTYAYLPDIYAPENCTESKEVKLTKKENIINPTKEIHKPCFSEDSDEEEPYTGLFKRIDLKTKIEVGDLKARKEKALKDSGKSRCEGRQTDSLKKLKEIECGVENAVKKKSREKLNKELKENEKVKEKSSNENPNNKRFLADIEDISSLSNFSSTSSTISSLSNFPLTSTSTSEERLPFKKLKTCENISTSQKSSEESILFTLRPNSYKIILNIDNTEIYGGSTEGRKKNSKEIMKEDLEKHKIDFRIRNLNVGDFLWTCQGVDSNGEEQELVLPFVVERKRMDDLGQSIRDGRFKEQKFRLKETGLTNLIYLVEEYGSNHSIVPISTCEQAITNTQIIDNFTIKVTKDQKESAAYLTIMTRYLQAKFKNKVVHCVNRGCDLLSSGTSSSTSVMYLLSFNELNSSSVKNRPFSVREMLAKHLLQINGASVDKVASIIKKYPTLRSLVEALESQPPSRRESLLCNIRCEKSGRMIDQSVSSHIARIYTWKNLL